MFLLFNEAKSRFTIKNVSRGGLLVGKKGWAFWMIYPHFVIGPWFRARKHATLAFPNTEQTGTLAIKRTRRTQIYVSLPQLQFPAKKNCYTRFSLFACRKVSANCSSFRGSSGLWIVIQMVRNSCWASYLWKPFRFTLCLKLKVSI